MHCLSQKSHEAVCTLEEVARLLLLAVSWFLARPFRVATRVETSALLEREEVRLLCCDKGGTEEAY